MKLATALENFKGVVSDDLSFASVEMDKNCWLTLPRWKSLCHRLSRDQTQPGSFVQRLKEAENRDPGKEVVRLYLQVKFNNAWKNNWKPLFALISGRILLKQLDYSLSISMRR